MLVELQKVQNLYGRRRGDYFSVKNILCTKLDTFESKCKSLSRLSSEISSVARNIKQATAKNGISWDNRWLRMKRPHAEMCNKFNSLNRLKDDVTKTARQAEKKRKVSEIYDKKVKRVRNFIDKQKKLQALFLESMKDRGTM